MIIPDKLTPDQMDELCRVLYEVPGGASWKVMRKLSGNLESVTRDQAVRVLKFFKEHEGAWEFL